MTEQQTEQQTDQRDIQELVQQSAIQAAIKPLQKEGTRIFLVGGMVRDHFSGKTGQDIDLLILGIAPSEVLKQLKEEGLQAQEVGSHFGVIKARIPNPDQSDEYLEVDYASPRSEKVTGEKHTDFEVELLWQETDGVEKDLSRRDMTGNAIAIELWPTLNIIDPYNGREDIQKQQLKTPGNISQSIKDDPLRILRFFVRVSKDGWKISHQDLREICRQRQELKRVSPERIRKELLSILEGKHSNLALKAMYATRVLDELIPEFKEARQMAQDNPHHTETVGRHLLSVACRFNGSPLGKLAALMHDIGKINTKTVEFKEGKVHAHFYGHEEEGEKITRKRLTRLRFQTTEIEQICTLVKLHMKPPRAQSVKAQRRVANQAGKVLPDLLALSLADRLSHVTQENESEEILRKQFREILESQSEISNKPINAGNIPLSGHDIKQMGPQGAEIGQIKRQVAQLVIDGEIANTEEACLKATREIIRANIKHATRTHPDPQGHESDQCCDSE